MRQRNRSTFIYSGNNTYKEYDKNGEVLYEYRLDRDDCLIKVEIKHNGK